MFSEKQPLLVNPTEEAKLTGGKKSKPTFRLIFFIRFFVVFLFSIAKQLEKLSQKQYIYRWIENNDIYNDTVDMLQNVSTTGQCGKNISIGTEKHDQRLTSDWMWYFSMTEHGFALLVITFYGIYSDYIGRKPLLLISLVGYFFRFGIMAFIVYNDVHLVYFFLAYGVSGLCGCQYSFYLGAMASIADKTENKTRSLSLAIFESLLGVGVSLSELSTGYLIKYAGYFYPIIISEGLTVLNVFLICYIPDTIEKKSTKHLNFRVGVKRLFGFYYDKSKLQNGKRWKFSFIITAFLFGYLLHTGKSNIETLYQMRSPFCWTSEVIGWYEFVVYLAQYFVAVVIMRILQICLMDEIICLLSYISFMVYSIIEGVAYTSMMLYLAAGTGILSGLLTSLLKSFCSRMVTSDHQGALFANLLVVENACQLISSSTFNNIYGLTQTFMPGLSFILIGTTMFIPFVLTVPVTISNKKQSKASH